MIFFLLMIFSAEMLTPVIEELPLSEKSRLDNIIRQAFKPLRRGKPLSPAQFQNLASNKHIAATAKRTLERQLRFTFSKTKRAEINNKIGELNSEIAKKGEKYIAEVKVAKLKQTAARLAKFTLISTAIMVGSLALAPVTGGGSLLVGGLLFTAVIVNEVARKPDINSLRSKTTGMTKSAIKSTGKNLGRLPGKTLRAGQSAFGAAGRTLSSFTKSTLSSGRSLFSSKVRTPSMDSAKLLTGTGSSSLPRVGSGYKNPTIGKGVSFIYQKAKSFLTPSRPTTRVVRAR